MFGMAYRMLRAAGLAAALTCTQAQAQAQDLTVFAAASLKDALQEVTAGYEAKTGSTVYLSFAGSSVLARQIEQGAPADVYISANTDWMDWLEEAGLIAADTRFDLLRNTLVLIRSGADAVEMNLTPDTDLAGMLGDGRLAMALVDAVPAGIYGKAALTSLGLWPGVADKVAQTDNVRAALALVALGEAPLGIVYATDAMAEPRVSAIATFPESSHPPIVYPAAAVQGSGAPAAAFLSHLRTPLSRAVFERLGFVVTD